jgi:hypothetical protein
MRLGLSRSKGIILIGTLVGVLGGQAAGPLRAAATCAVNVGGNCIVPGTGGALIPVPATDTTFAISRVCPAAAETVCTAFVELVVGAHNEFATPPLPTNSSGTSASTASSTTCNPPSSDNSTAPDQYVDWWVYEWSGGSSWNDSNNDWRVEMNGNDAYDGCSDVSNWVNRAACQGYAGYGCGGYSLGAFWDSQKMSNTAYLNQNITYQDFLGVGGDYAELRWWMTGQGQSNAAAYSSCTTNC